MVQAIVTWKASKKLKFMAPLLGCSGSDVIATLNPQAGSCQPSGSQHLESSVQVYLITALVACTHIHIFAALDPKSQDSNKKLFPEVSCALQAVVLWSMKSVLA